MRQSFIPRKLTIDEKLEMSRLKRRLFTDGSPFLTLTEDIESSEDYKRYNELVRIMLLRLGWEKQKSITQGLPCSN